MGGLLGVTRTDNCQVRNPPEAHDLLYGLVGGAILPHADAVMGEDIETADPRQACDADCRTHVVGKHEERGCIGDHAAVQCHAGGDSGHCMFANPEVYVPAVIPPAFTHRPLDVITAESGVLEIPAFL